MPIFRRGEVLNPEGMEYTSKGCKPLDDKKSDNNPERVTYNPFSEKARRCQATSPYYYKITSYL